MTNDRLNGTARHLELPVQMCLLFVSLRRLLEEAQVIRQAGHSHFSVSIQKCMEDRTVDEEILLL